jgi:hypothetical protein
VQDPAESVGRVTDSCCGRSSASKSYALKECAAIGLVGDVPDAKRPLPGGDCGTPPSGPYALGSASSLTPDAEPHRACARWARAWRTCTAMTCASDSKPHALVGLTGSRMVRVLYEMSVGRFLMPDLPLTPSAVKPRVAYRDGGGLGMRSSASSMSTGAVGGSKGSNGSGPGGDEGASSEGM